MIVGHNLGPLQHPTDVMLFLGPRGVGKMTVARHLVARVWAFEEGTFLRSTDMSAARALVHLVQTRPQGGRRVVVLRLNHTSIPVQTVLLKALEDAQDTTFVLLAEQMPRDVIASRAQVHRFRPLTREQVSVLLQRQGTGAKKADALAALADGTVRGARAAESMLEMKPDVMIAVRAIAEQDPVALDRLSGKWTEQHTEMLRRWVHEVLSRDFGVYSELDALLSRPMALKILLALSSDVRPRLQVRAGLMGLVVA